uniref:Endonuclease/exonuclease/phosphatase domain-containing protein n=1 Tax=Sander lucioperca TaxID=283035 RepID=A0A8D0CTK3_SANLU
MDKDVGGWVGHIFHSIFHSKSRGTAILIKKTTPFVVSKADADSAGRYIIVVGRLNSTPVVLANVYAPNWDDSAFFTSLFSRIPDIDTHHVILGGDINCVLSPPLDRSSPKTMQLTQLFPILLAVYDESSISGSLPETMRQAVISLIHKKGKSKLDCSSY